MCLSVVVTDSINSVVVIAVHCYCYCSCCVCLQHPGVGIDLRKRNIWDTYGPDVHLEVIINCEMLLIAFTHTHIHICRHAHTCMHTCMHAHAHTNMRMHKQMHTHTHTVSISLSLRMGTFTLWPSLGLRSSQLGLGMGCCI